jgi:hypothetical protein
MGALSPISFKGAWKMLIYTEHKTVYYCKGRKVIKEGLAGDNFGFVRDIKTGEGYTTYGYNTLKVIGKIKIAIDTATLTLI